MTIGGQGKMALWLVRAGSHGEQEQGALENNVVTIGWNEIPDISKINDKEALKELYVRLNPNSKKMRIIRMVGQIWDFAKDKEG
jgi:restriction system protein